MPDGPTYTVPQLDQMILLALRLGYHDDVRHWREVRAQIVAATPEGTK